MKILIVDDHVLFREGLVSLFSRQSDMTVVGEAGTVEEAINLARRLHPDVILMDFSLPDGTGLEATRAVLSDHPETKIVFLTIHDDDERLFAAIRAGAKGFLIKNIPVVKLLAAIRGLQSGEAALSRIMTNRLIEELARHPGVIEPANNPLNTLTSREMEVLAELANNATNREIAQRLYISENTVRNHMHNILEKLNLNSRREAVALARQFPINNNKSKKG